MRSTMRQMSETNQMLAKEIESMKEFMALNRRKDGGDEWSKSNTVQPVIQKDLTSTRDNQRYELGIEALVQ